LIKTGGLGDESDLAMLFQQALNGVAHDHGVVDQQYLDEPSMPDEK
jgi:hypothetical protein